MSVRALPVDRLHCPARTVLHAQCVAVAQADDAVARGELLLRDGESLRAEPTMRLHERASQGVELGNVATTERDHDVGREIVLSRRPPVREEAGLRGDCRLLRDQATPAIGEREVVAPDSVSDRCERPSLLRVALASVLGQLDGPNALGNAREQPARSDRWKLVGISDQHGLSVRPVDAIEQRREHACLRHPCLIDHDHAADREILGQQPVQRRRVDAGLVLELLGGDAGRGCAKDGRPGLAERLADSAGGSRLARPGESDHADDAVGGAGHCAHHRRLLA